MSINMLHSLERHVENPYRTREKGRMKCVKKAHWVSDKSQRGRRTLHCHTDIPSVREVTAKDIANPVALSQGAADTHGRANTHTLVSFIALVEPL